MTMLCIKNKIKLHIHLVIEKNYRNMSHLRLQNWDRIHNT